MDKETYTGRRLIGVKEMLIKLNTSRTALYHMINAGLVPKPIRLAGKLGWDSKVIDQWMDDLVAGKYDNKPDNCNNTTNRL